MNVSEAIRIALQSLWANKLRSALTLLGVVIGVAAVIAVVTFVNGINGYVAERVFRLGTDVFIVFKGSPAVTNVDHFLEGEKRKDLNMEDYRAVLEACQHCLYVGASLRNLNGHVKYNEQSISDAWVQGLTPSMAPIFDVDLESGRMLNETDLESRAAVAVVGTDIVENLMPGVDPLGKDIRVDSWTYQVIGVGKKKGKTLGQSLDDYVMIPITAYLKQYGTHDNSIRISGKAAGVGPSLEAAMDEARAVLRARRHDPPDAGDRRIVAARPEHGTRLIHGRLQRRAYPGSLARDANAIVMCPILLQVGGYRNHDVVVQALSQSLALLLSHPDYLVRPAIHANVLAERVHSRHQVFYDVRADDRHRGPALEVSFVEHAAGLQIHVKDRRHGRCQALYPSVANGLFVIFHMPIQITQRRANVQAVRSEERRVGN